MVPLIAGIIWLGVHPQPVLDRMEGAATRFVQHVETRASRAMAER
jgi:NADH:ubiquinone oxidoreductase subunit 4 (subunit M)